MSYKVYSRAGGAPAASMTDITARVPAFDEVTPVIQMGMSAQDGASSQGTLIIPDPVGNVDDSLYFPPHTLIRWTEDATGDELWLAQGRVTSYEIGRADVKAADNVQWNLTVLDANIDLRGLAFTEPWVRPEETGTDRLYALAAYTLNGTSSTRPDYAGDITYRPSTDITVSSTHLAPDTNTVLMPAKTYKVGTQPIEVVDDCAQTEAKVGWGVVPHHTGGSTHACLLYTLETDHSTYASTVKISDHIADWDPDDPTAPVFEPHWDQGFGQVVDGTANVSGLVSLYGTDASYIPVLDTTSADANEYWVESYYDSESETSGQAAARAASLLAYRKPPTETNRVSIEMAATQHDLITAGMSIQVKAAPINTGNVSTVGTYIYRRIASLQWEPIADGRYRAIMLLNRGIRRPGSGQLQPAATVPAAGVACDPASSPHYATYDAARSWKWDHVTDAWDAGPADAHLQRLNQDLDTSHYPSWNKPYALDYQSVVIAPSGGPAWEITASNIGALEFLDGKSFEWSLIRTDWGDGPPSGLDPGTETVASGLIDVPGGYSGYSYSIPFPELDIELTVTDRVQLYLTWVALGSTHPSDAILVTYSGGASLVGSFVAYALPPCGVTYGSTFIPGTSGTYIPAGSQLPAPTALEVPYDPTASGIDLWTAQEAIDELVARSDFVSSAKWYTD